MRRGAAGNLYRIISGEARIAELVAMLAGIQKRVQTLPAQIAERIRADIAPDLIDRMRRGEQLLASRRVDAVKARMRSGRSRDSHVHLARTRLPEHRDDLPERSPAYQRIFDEHDAFVAQQLG